MIECHKKYKHKEIFTEYKNISVQQAARPAVSGKKQKIKNNSNQTKLSIVKTRVGEGLSFNQDHIIITLLFQWGYKGSR